MIVKVDLVLLAAPWHCEIWRAAKDSFKNRTNYVNYRTIFQFRMMCRACAWQRARRSHWGRQRQPRELLRTTAGWMFCMSNKRDFHNIILTMLRDLSAQDHVLQEEGRFRGGGAAGEPLGIFLLGTAWFLSPDWEQDPGAGGLSGLATGSSHVQSVHIRISPGGGGDKGWTEAVTEAIRCTLIWIQTMCGHAYITPPSVYLFIIPFSTFNWL